jgi:hypothetical protein
VADFQFEADASDVTIDLDPAANPIDVKLREPKSV